MADGKTMAELKSKNARLRLENETTLIALEAGVSAPVSPDVASRTQAAFNYVDGGHGCRHSISETYASPLSDFIATPQGVCRWREAED